MTTRQLYRKGLLNLRGPAAPLRDPALVDQLIEKLGNKNSYVHAEPPFGGPEHVLRYLGRYTHRMAISNHRIRRGARQLPLARLCSRRQAAHHDSRCRELPLPLLPARAA